MNLAKYSLDNTKIIYFFLAVLLIGGISSFGKLGKKEDAPFVIKSAVIMTRYPGAGRSGTSDNRAYLSRDTKYEWCVQD